MMLRLFGWWFRLKGWKLGDGIPPEIKKCVVVAAPHTSNWDFVYAMAALHLMGIKVRYLAKKELFKFPLKSLLLSTGAIPVERSKRTGMVDCIVSTFAQHNELVLLIAGEGTRKRVNKWKSGLWHVADKTGLPIMPAYLDYAKKEAGFGPPTYTTGNMDTDAAQLRNFYADKTGRFPELFNLDGVRFR
jgi:1-acyl-sn-glycerol-3-phosphate acyltransferase